MALASFVCSQIVLAHGGVGVIGNQCILTIGPYQMYFSGYQPTVSGEEFCDDIPAAGNTIIVLDFLQPALRQHDIDYRIIRDVNNIGTNASFKDLASVVEIQAETIFYYPAQQHKTGTFKFEYDFSDGNYIGLVSATNVHTQKKHLSVFAFSVGKKTVVTPEIILFISIMVALISIVMYKSRNN